MKDRDGRPKRESEWEPLKILFDENKTYVPNSIQHVSILTANVRQANSWRAYPRNG